MPLTFMTITGAFLLGINLGVLLMGMLSTGRDE